MMKYPSVSRIGHEANEGILSTGDLLVQEKMDGANFRFTWSHEQGRILFGSRNVEWTNENDTNKRFREAVEYVRENIDLTTFRDHAEMFDGFTVYGEAMMPHTLEYDWDETPSVIVYDVFDDLNGWWNRPYEMAETLALPAAPVLYEGPAESFTEDQLDVPWSEYRSMGVAEGIVIKNNETGQKAKFRSAEFKELHGNQDSNSDDAAGYQDDASKELAATFTTPARVKKEIAKMRDEGETVGMSMMDVLWKRVFNDVIGEEFETIFHGEYVLNTKRFRSEVAAITAEVLQDVLSSPASANDGVIA